MHACWHLRVYESVDERFASFSHLLDFKLGSQARKSDIKQSSFLGTIAQEDTGNSNTQSGNNAQPTEYNDHFKCLNTALDKMVYIYTVNALICPFQRIKTKFPKFCP